MKNKIKKFLCLIFSLTIILSLTFITPVDAAAKYYTMIVHYLDVGESDCVLIQSGGKSMVIDAGNAEDAGNIIKYLKKQKVNKIDILLLTHPHADHIGSAPDLIQQFKIGKIIMTDVVHTTKTFEDVLDAIEDKGIKATKPKVGAEYTIGNAKFTILAPNDVYDNLNDNSIAIRLVNGKNSFLFLGDCEEKAIDDILDNGINIDSDTLMCGHHGSSTSTSKKLLDAITPTYACISVGKNNDYNHPHHETLDLLSEYKIKTYRTDEKGTIVATSTGTKITFNVAAEEAKNNSEAETRNDNAIVYITKSGKKYHRPGCSSLKQNKIKTTVKEAKNKGYTPCKICNPPE